MSSLFNLRYCTILKNRQDACSTKDKFSCGTGILPVQKRLIENGARCDLNSTYKKRIKNYDKSTLRSPRVSERTDDDLTLLLATFSTNV
ncbi:MULTISPECIES: hypothetical protein [unclassified Microcoleus]|uniref:hypothetical protein n=1 Tax=unclassified Microcoleus TaxID=2642155 RepID=UPI002FD51111